MTAPRKPKPATPFGRRIGGPAAMPRPAVAKARPAQLRRGVALMALGMAAVLVPVFGWVHYDTIRALPSIAAIAEMLDDTKPQLVTFGPGALVSEGDHDFRQLVRFSAPASAGTLHVRVFDPDAGGRFDEASYGAPKGVYDTSTRFSLYGTGASARIFRDANGVVQEEVQGAPLDTKTFASDGAADGRWVTLFSVDAARGIEAGDRREFVLLVEGTAGNDGNVFDVAISRSDEDNDVVAGARLYSLMPTFQVPRDGNRLTELGFEVPAGASALAVENFDAAGGTVTFAGRFRSQTLGASAKSAWRHDDVALEKTEAAAKASVTAQGGRERPNDMTLFVGESKAGGDAVDNPLPIELPLQIFAPNRRPQIKLATTALACSQMRFDASNSKDPDGRALVYRWLLDGKAVEGSVTEQRFATFGEHAGRLELFDGSGMVGAGSAQDFTFLVKEPPVARFTGPALVAEGGAVLLDGTGSSAPLLPEGNAIAEYRWSLGDGREVVQKAGDKEFGRMAVSYPLHGDYTVKLTVTDSADNPCNSATSFRTVAVNGAPVANAGEDWSVVPGQALAFDAGVAMDTDGNTLAFNWDFGDGATADAAKASHSYAKPGTYAVTLVVDDGKGAANSISADSASVFVNAPPEGSDLKVPEQLVAGQPGLFDASGARDPDGKITRTAWSFGDGVESARTSARHSYARPGTYEVKLAISDDSGLANATTTITRTVTVVDPGNTPPVADAGGKRQAVVDAVIAFDGMRSHDPDGSILRYRWEFGDGSGADGIAARHAYRKAGIYHATLTVTDDSGRQNARVTNSFDVTIAEKDNVAPVLSAGSDRAAFVNQIVAFDATKSADSDGSVVAVDWDFGDGAKASGFSARHTYLAPGTYMVRVRARDDSGRPNAMSETSFTVSVTHKHNQPPAAEIAAELSLQTEIPFTFDASKATDPDGQITRYRWEFGDGAGTDEPVIAHAYARPGTYKGTLSLTDDSGLANGTTVKDFTVTVEERHNTQPVAAAGADQTAIVGQRVDFDGGASSDSDGSLTGYFWDFGNGKKASGQKRSIVYFAPGTYTVTLDVADNSGQANAVATDTLTVTVTDKPNLAPVAAVDGDRRAAIDEPVSFSGARSRDPDGNILAYVWDPLESTCRHASLSIL